MTKKRGIFSKLFFSVVLLTLISCCFLGSTFARYTSGGSGTATLEVAKWDVKNTKGSLDVTFDQLSPSMDAYDATPRTNTTGKKTVATITNSGDVNALVTFAFGATEVAFADGWSWGKEEDTDDPYTTAVASLEAFEKIVTVHWYYNDTEDNAEGATEWDGTATAGFDLAPGETVYIYTEVIWTSDDETVTGEAADKRDTWIGQYVESVTYPISYTAVQNTELPNA